MAKRVYKKEYKIGLEQFNRAQEDRRIIQKFLDGDQQAFTELVLFYRPYVYGIVSKTISNHSDIEEVVNDVFFKVQKNLFKFRGDCVFRTWMTRIAFNTAYGRYSYNKTRGSNVTLSIETPLRLSHLTIKDTVIDNETLSPKTEADLREIEQIIKWGISSLR